MFAKSKLKFVSLIVLLLALSSCVGSVLKNETAAVASSTVETSLQYVDGTEKGPTYNVSLNVPDGWVGQYQTRNFGNKVVFEYVVDGSGNSQVLSIEALSPGQYWRQAGSQPGSYVNIVNKGDTYFIYHMPIDGYYNNWSVAEFEAFAAEVPDVIASFDAQASN